MSDLDIDDNFDDIDEELDEDEDEKEDNDEDEKEDEEDIEDELKDTQISKLKYIVIHPNNRRTSNTLSLFEYTNVVGTRAQMIDSSIHEYIYIPLKGCLNAIEMAEQEVTQNRCPLSIERIVYQDFDTIKVEIWSVNELIKLSTI